MIDAFKGVSIGLELREFDRMCAMRVVYFGIMTKSRFGKNQSYEVLTPDRRCISDTCSSWYQIYLQQNCDLILKLHTSL